MKGAQTKPTQLPAHTSSLQVAPCELEMTNHKDDKSWMQPLQGAALQKTLHNTTKAQD